MPIYTESKLVIRSEAENIKKGPYLVVNRLHGKPCSGSSKESLRCLTAWQKSFCRKYGKEKNSSDRFAETATKPIGAASGGRLSALYIQTNERTDQRCGYFYFNEQHSHATEQKLVKDDLDQAADWAERIIFIEDEITTGNKLEYYPATGAGISGAFHYSALSILNGMTEEYESLNRTEVFGFTGLVKTCHDDYSRRAAGYAKDGKYHPCDIKCSGVRPEEYRIPGGQNARRLIKGREYRESM